MDNLNKLPVFLSASLPAELAGTSRAQSLFDFLAIFVSGLFASNGNIIFGGHPSITPIIYRLAVNYGTLAPKISLFQLARFRYDAPSEVMDKNIFQEVNWIGSEKDDNESLQKSLDEMRMRMVSQAQAGVFLGGNTTGYYGNKPGIIAEYEHFLNQHSNGPAYLIGLLGGGTLNLIKANEDSGMMEPNSLNTNELRAIHHNNNIDLISSVVLTDLVRNLKQIEQ